MTRRATGARPFHEEDAAYFIGVNRNKRSIGLDLASEGGRAVLMKLLESGRRADREFQAGHARQMGHRQRGAARKFPRLVHCRISGFGADGPRGGNPGYDAIIQAMTGMIAATGSRESGPIRIGVPVVDITTGLYAAIGILMALSERQKSGRAVPRNHALRNGTCGDASACRELFYAWQAAKPDRQRASEPRALRDLPDQNR